MSEDALDPLVTQCPNCDTRFRVSEQQLQVASGRVRCGACLTVFDGADYLILDDELLEVDESAVDDVLAEIDEFDESEIDTLDRHRVMAGLDSVTALDADADVAAEGVVDLSVLDQLEEDLLADLHPPPRPDGPDEALAEDGKDAQEIEDTAPVETIAAVAAEAPVEHADADETSAEVPIVEEAVAQEHLVASEETLVEETREDVVLEDEILEVEEAREEAVQEEAAREEELDAEEGISEAEPTADADKEEAWFEEVANELWGEEGPPEEVEAAAAAQLQSETTPAPAEEDEPLEVAALAEPSIDELPDLMADDTEAPQGRSWVTYVLIAVAAIALPAQVLWFQYEDWVADPTYRPIYEGLCAAVGCEVPALVDVTLIEAQRSVGRVRPDSDARTIDILMVNKASFAQPFPVIEVEFENLQGRRVALSRLRPEQYLPQSQPAGAEMQPRTPVHVSFEVPDPGDEATGFSVRFTE